MLCVFCEKENIGEKYTEYIKNYKGKKIIVKDVPALFCETCGDYYFTNQTIQLINTYVRNHIEDIKDNVSVIDFNNIAIKELVSL